MNIYRSIAEPSRPTINWKEKWHGPDQGLIACWERGRKKVKENPILASQARDVKQVKLLWKGGVNKTIFFRVPKGNHMQTKEC